MRFQKDNEIVLTFNPTTQAELIAKGYKVIEYDTEIQPTQKDVEIVDAYTVKKKPVKRS